MFEIPTSNEFPFYDQKTKLFDTLYRLNFRYSQKESRWYLDIFSEEDVPVMLGIKLVDDFPLMRNKPESLRPDGEIYCVSINRFGPPGLRDLSISHQLVHDVII